MLMKEAYANGLASTEVDVDSDFARHVAEFLRKPQAQLSSRFIYDDRGSKLFQDIMALEEYYLTRCEFEILSSHAAAIASAIVQGDKPLELIELGAGDGLKTKILLQELLRQGRDFVYRPVDISGDILDALGADLRQNLPGLRFEPICSTYAEALDSLQPDADVHRVMLFLGSNLGNYSLDQAGRFMAALVQPLGTDDQVLIGIDLRKDPRQILRAYDDASGVTAAFNLNLLHRLRHELDAELDLDGWMFFPSYNPETGEVRSYLYPLGEQRIRIAALEFDRVFGAHETIHSEVSRKYSLAELASLGSAVDAQLEQTWTDERGWFADVLLRVAG